MAIIELAPVRTFGAGITVEEVLATRAAPEEGLPLPAIEELAPYSFCTAERRGRAAPIEVRLWMNERDASEYLARKEKGGALAAGGLFSVLPSRRLGTVQ